MATPPRIRARVARRHGGAGALVVQRPAPRRAFPQRAGFRCDVTQSSYRVGRAGSGQPVPRPPHAEPGEQAPTPRGTARSPPTGAARSCRPAGRPPAGCSPRPSAGRGTGRPAGPRTAPSTAVVGRGAAQSASQAGSVATTPSASSVSLVRTQSPRSAVCTVIDSGRPDRPALIPSRVSVLITTVAVVGGTRCGRTHSGTATCTTTYRARVSAMAGIGTAQHRAEGDPQDDREHRVGHRHHAPHRERHRRQVAGQAPAGVADHPVEGCGPPGHGQRDRTRPPAPRPPR